MNYKLLCRLIAFQLVAAGCGWAQTAADPATASKPMAFEVASIRQKTRGGERRFEPTPNGYRMTNMPLMIAMVTAYMPSSGASLFTPNSVQGVPEWAQHDRFDIDARVSEADLPEWQKPSQQPAMLRAMLQAMLAERCKLVVHRDSREESIYSLVVAKSGPKMKQTVPGETHPAGRTFPNNGGVMGPEGPDRIVHFYEMPMATFAVLLSDLAGRQVRDDTGLTARYDITIQHPADNDVSSRPPDSAPTVFSALAELGLKLVPVKRQVETLVIDHLERPTEN